MQRALFFTFFLSLLLTASSAEAYYTTNQDSFSLNGKIAVFVIDYAFGHATYDLTMPLAATRGLTTGDTSLGYEIRDAEGNPGKGSAVGIVLSDSSMTSYTYRVPKKSVGTFRMLVLYTRTDAEVGKSFHAQVTHLPFAFTNIQNLALNESELEHYKTPPVTLLQNSALRVTNVTVR